MTRSHPLSFLTLLFVGTICNSMVISFIGFYIVEGLGRAPWSMSVYTGLFAFSVILSNRVFARTMDQGANPFPMIGVAVLGYLIATFALLMSPAFLTVVSIGVIGFGISSSAMSTKFSIGGVISDRANIKHSTFNAYMRATTSTSWMIGPALSFVVADRLGAETVFAFAFALGLLWLALWWGVAPRDAVTNQSRDSAPANDDTRSPEFRIAILFVFCLALAHSLTFSALPIFFVQEVGLPGYAPGVAFSLKTFVELFAIFSTPFLIARFGLRASLIGTALLAVAAIIVLATTGSFAHMLIGAALEGFYFGLFSTLAISFVQSLSQDRPAYATAMYWNTMMITLVVAGPTAGLIAQISDFQTVIVTGSLCAIISAAVLGWGTGRTRSKHT